MKLFSKEVKDMSELNEVLKNNNEVSKEYEVAVIVYAFDSENKIVFQRRGLGCRDEQLKLETIGGRVKKSDIDFRTALQREIEEEIGTRKTNYKLEFLDNFKLMILNNTPVNEFKDILYLHIITKKINFKSNYLFRIFMLRFKQIIFNMRGKILWKK